MMSERPDECEDALGLRVALLGAFGADASSGGLRPVEDYLSRYPGYEDLVRSEYASFSDVPAHEDEVSGPDAPGPGGRIGPYLLEDLIGRGGQGQVFRASDTRMRRRVALKLLTARVLATPEERARFEREAELLARLDHPGIATILDSGEHEGRPWLAMRLIDGPSLASRMRGDGLGEEGWPFVARMGIRLAEALTHAHGRGVVHRDVKPANVLLDQGAEAALVDFGLAADRSADATSLTLTGDVFGTPAYMAPEQVRGESADERTDIHGLGATLHHAITGTAPYSGPSREVVLAAVEHAPPPDARVTNPSCPRGLVAIVQKAMAKRPADRYATAAALREDLEALLEGRPTRARPIGPVKRLVLRARRRPRVAALIVLTVLLALGLAATGGFLLASRETIEAGEQALVARGREERAMIAWAHLGEGSAEIARSTFEALLAEDRSDITALAGLVLSEVRGEDLDAARAHIAGHPRREEPAIRALARGLRDLLGDLSTDGEPELPRTPDRCFVEGQLAMRRGHAGDRRGFTEALTWFTEAITRSEVVPALYLYQRTHAAAHIPHRRIAREGAEVMIERWPDAAGAAYWAGFAHHAFDLEVAAEHLRRATRLDPSFGPAWSDLGNVLAGLGRHEQAIEVYGQAAKLLPELPHPWSGIGQSARQLGREAEAIAGLERALAIDPRFEPALVDLAALHHGAGRFELADGFIARAVALPRASLPAWINRAIIAASLGDGDLRDRALQEVLARSPKHRQARRMLSDARFDAGDLDGALEILDQLVTEFDRDADALVRRGRVHTKLEKPDLARADYEAALSIDEDDATAWVGLGDLALAAGNGGRAVQHFEEALARKGEDPRVRLRLAGAELLRYRFTEAMQHAELGRVLAAKSPAAARQIRAVERAVRMGSQVLETLDRVLADPSRARVRDLMRALRTARKQERPDREAVIGLELLNRPRAASTELRIATARAALRADGQEATERTVDAPADGWSARAVRLLHAELDLIDRALASGGFDGKALRRFLEDLAKHPEVAEAMERQDPEWVRFRERHQALLKAPSPPH